MDLHSPSLWVWFLKADCNQKLLCKRQEYVKSMQFAFSYPGLKVKNMEILNDFKLRQHKASISLLWYSFWGRTSVIHNASCHLIESLISSVWPHPVGQSELHDIRVASEGICNPRPMALTKHQILWWVKNFPEWYFNTECQFLSEIFLFLSFWGWPTLLLMDSCFW